MTFKEYLNQSNPARHPQVWVTEEDCDSIFPNYADNSMVITLRVHDTIHMYVMPLDSDHLYTIDGDGNKQKLSCFRFKKNETS